MSLAETHLPFGPTVEAAEPLPKTGPRDARLAAALKRGERNAAAALFDQHGAHVRRVLLHLLGPDQELQDLVHECFLRAFTGVRRLRQDDRLRAWLSGIAVRVAKEHMRRRVRRRATLPFDEQRGGAGASRLTPDRQALLRATHRVLASLPTRERLPFSLRCIAGMPLQETADACGISLATAKRRVRRARERFLLRSRNEPTLRDWLAEERR